ncbi:MAG TPA: CPBP family intramembrane glutamic endopeptidase [Pseudonocardiaceae bacterium]|jgi:membrane protease YdiL (CAAX protease family)
MADQLAVTSVESRADIISAGQVEIPQYSRRSILAIWAAAALPMGGLAWVVAPLLASGGGDATLIRALLWCLTAGLIWQFVLVVGLVWFEQRSLRWSTLRSVLWLNAPSSPRTGRTGGRVWLVVLPLIAALAAEELVPSLPHPGARDLGVFLGSDAGHAMFHGAWDLFALVVVLGIFNTALGEELLFRGFLLPRMNGAFGRADWVANGVLFAAYHLHVPWVIPAGLLDTFILAYPAKRFRSALIGIVVHSAQTVFFTLAVLALVR